ncbi:MAG: nucleotidyltransferase domain-containing protein [Nitrospirae bacterium]|nr:nucleotidyltransferase domain-containing protein [Nitrospirota bacterium]MCL5978755.1 nucleotidyltransferase domain-containing protein [Nitrospirota bacterium]
MARKEDKKIIYRKIKDYIKILKGNGIDVWRLYLFGSYAKNRFTAESDIDLAVFLNKDDIDAFMEDVKLMRLRRQVDLRIEPHSFALSDFKEPDPFIKEIITTGKRII